MIDRQQLGRDLVTTFDEWLNKAKRGDLSPNDLEDWNNPACVAYDREGQRECTFCPLEGTICKATQSAFEALCDDRDPIAPLTTARALLGVHLWAWLQCEQVREDAAA